MKLGCVSVTLLCFLGVVVANFGDRNGRIVGGSNAISNYPFMVSLRERRLGGEPNEYFCSGFVFNERWIVTAAHCVRDRTEGQITAHMGTTLRTDLGDSHDVERIAIHPNYDWQRVLNNIAMLKCADEIIMSPSVRPIPIAGFVAPGTPARVTGWGATRVNGPMADTLQVLQVQIISRDDCLARHTVINRRFIHENTTCSLSPVGRGLCSGDGGSPLVIGEGDTREVVGIASWNMPCATGVPDVFVRLSNYQSWINECATNAFCQMR